MIPTKLKDDAIIEAVCQVQFASKDLPEVIIGRLSDFPDARLYQQKSLPIADIPAPIRRSDPNLRTQPLMQLVHPDGRLVQIGERALSAHVVGPKSYPGWVQFRAHLGVVIAQLFEKVKDVQIENVTLRYINALVKDRHHVDGLHSLNVEIVIAGAKFGGPVNLNFVDRPNDHHVVTTRIAAPSFVQGKIPDGTTVVVDVEVSTGNRLAARTLDDVLAWIETAHTLEKVAFFKLLPKDVVKLLSED